MFSYVLKNIVDGSECKNRTILTITKGDIYLEVEFRCEYFGKLDVPYTRYNDPIYRGEVVEFFIGAKDEETYFEFDLAPNNTLFNARIFYHEKYGAFTKVIDEKFVLHSVVIKDDEYIASMKIPFEKIGEIGEKYVFNAYRIASNGFEKEYQALNPTGKLDFHYREKFIELETRYKK